MGRARYGSTFISVLLSIQSLGFSKDTIQPLLGALPGTAPPTLVVAFAVQDFLVSLLFHNMIYHILIVQKGIVAGVPFFDEVFRQLDCMYVNPYCFRSAG